MSIHVPSVNMINRILALLLCMLFCVSSAPAQDWPMVNRNRERTSWTGPLLRFAPPLTRRAPISVPLGAQNLVSFRGILYASTGGYPNMVAAVEAATGRILWADSIPRSVAGNEVVPAVDENNVYFCGQQGTGLFAFDRLTGAHKWSRLFGTLYARCPVLDGGRLYLVRDTLWCLDAATGATVWTTQMNATASPAVDETAVYVSGNGSIASFHKLTGDPRWSVTKTTKSYGSLAVDVNHLYASYQDSIAAFRASDGALRWGVNLAGRIISDLAGNAIAITDSVLCYGFWKDSSGTGGIAALDIRSGAHLWSRNFSVEGAYTPTIVDGVVYACDWTIGQFWGFALRTGAVVFRDTLDTYEYQPIFADGVLYIGSGTSIYPFVSSATGIERTAPVRPEIAILASPNPFTTSTTIHLSLASPTAVRVYITDALGRCVTTLFIGVLPGDLRLAWNGVDARGFAAPSGMYHIVAETGTGTQRTGILLLR